LKDNKAVELLEGDCFFCDKPRNGKYFNGIDRVSNNLGYEVINCVSCCTMCNMIKCDFNVEALVMKSEHILSYYNRLDNKKHYYQYFRDVSGCAFNSCERSAKERNKDFKLNKQQHAKLTKNPCYICGKKNSKTHQNGIDRYDNNVGYIYDNCRSCCADCNLMKKDYKFDNFLSKLEKIVANKKKILGLASVLKARLRLKPIKNGVSHPEKNRYLIRQRRNEVPKSARDDGTSNYDVVIIDSDDFDSDCDCDYISDTEYGNDNCDSSDYYTDSSSVTISSDSDSEEDSDNED
jgi:hypothetical protein